jgi:histidinol-phosphatase
LDLREYLDFAAQTAHEAGRLTLGYFRTGEMRTDFKPDDTPVTAADRQAERLIQARIGAKYPGHTVVEEEYGAEEGTDASHRWIVDPIDGTKAFARGVPLYGVLIGLEIEGTCEIGAAYFPALDEMVYAATGEGCYCNGRRTRVSSAETLEGGILSFTDAATFEKRGREEAFRRLRGAAGRVELMLDPVIKPWDCAPFPPILREAGAYFGDWSGNQTIQAGEALSTPSTLLPEVLRLIEG